ncbi:MAG: hypothetical protein CL677_05000 [Bdellovibrionaceae bacterium]|nr:hypothetical protein [Pseudobdellovibrionaceae bacterium]|tara:strand:- start:110128 stop:111312 length:1185 start_codon:yes stop_codon:yes gene_type:complete
MGSVTNKLFRLLAVFVLFSTFQASAESDVNDSSLARRSIKQDTSSSEIKVMSYNVLNLFDAQHDSGKLDHTFLPLSYRGKVINCQRLSRSYYREECLNTDWTDEKVVAKIAQIKKVVEMQGDLPDLLAVQEIENANVAGMLQRALGYDAFVITNSPDKRGIDVALLYKEDKLRYLNHEELDITEQVGFETRNILKVHFQPKVGTSSNVIGVYVNHWPSQASGPIARMSAANALSEFIDRETQEIGRSKYHVLVMGDFNTLRHEVPNAFHNVLNSPYWDNYLFDVQTLSEDSSNNMTLYMPPGTYWYSAKGKYQRFDRFFISHNLRDTAGLSVIPNTYRIVGTPENTREVRYRSRDSDYYPSKQRVPLRYNFNTLTESELGFSDHFPIVVKFKLR